MAERRREALLREYGEVTASFRSLTDIRFRLLGLLPLAAIATAALKDDKSSAASFVLSLFGLIATIGLITYNARNDQLYDELVGRAASIERSLGLPDGSFANRMFPWLTFNLGLSSWKIDHRTGISAVYASTIALWLFGVFAPIAALIRYYIDFNFPYLKVANPLVWIHAVALGLAIIVTWAGYKLVEVQKERQQADRRKLAVEAVRRALKIDRATASQDELFMQMCANLRDGKKSTVEVVRARASFLGRLDADAIDFYLWRGSGEQEAAHFVALLTDMPPRWLFDCATDRTGALAKDNFQKKLAQ